MSTSRERTPLVLGSLAVLAIGLGAGAVLVHVPAPSVLAGTGVPSIVPVVERELDDARTVGITLESVPAQPLVVLRDGRVTASSCVPGRVIASGDSPLSVDGAELVALATATPLWRDLTVGDRGADVTALTELLHDADMLTSAVGTLDEDVLDAAASLSGSLVTDGRVDHTAVLWLPADETTVTTCEAPVGTLVGTGDAIATLPARLTSARLADLPADAVVGPRELVVDGTTITLDGSDVTEAGLAELTGTASYRQAATGETGTELTAQWRLTEPVPVAVVPPAAVTGAGTGSTCVVDDEGVTHEVTVVGSQLGQTFVRIDGQAPARVTTAPGAARCT